MGVGHFFSVIPAAFGHSEDSLGDVCGEVLSGIYSYN